MLRWVVLAIALLLFAGCGKSKEEKAVEDVTGGKVKIDGDQITVQNEDGTTSTFDRDGQNMRIENPDGSVVTREGDTTKLTTEDSAITVTEGSAGDFPLPFMPGTTVERTQKMKTADGEMYQVGLRVKQSVNEVAEFYSEVFKQHNLQISSAEDSDGTLSEVAVTGESQQNDASVLIQQRSGEDESTVQLHWSTRKPRPAATAPQSSP